jgi:hypothetical protein
MSGYLRNGIPLVHRRGISKMVNYLVEKMHKKVLTKKDILVIFSENNYLSKTFLGCILSLRYVNIFEIGKK